MNMSFTKSQRTFLITLGIATIVVALIGATFAYWSWETTSGQRTAVSFTIGNGFSCSADGGGNITSSDIMLAPSTCTNSTYAIKRTVKVNTTQNAGKKIYLDMNLKVNSIGTGLAGTTNFKYALTTGSNSCTDGVVKTGNFVGATTNTEKPLLSNKEYAATTSNDTYYLWIWLDAAETSATTQNQTFNISLSGSCTDEEPTTFTGTIYRYSYSSVILGQQIVLQAKQAWCANSSEFGNSCDFSVSWGTQQECEDYVTNQNMENTTCSQGTVQPISYETNPSNLNKTFYLKHEVVDDITTESYVGFIITPEMAMANPGMTAGTYYLRGLDTYDSSNNCKSQYLNSGNCLSPYYEDNKLVLQNAFGSSNCTDSSSHFNCEVSGLYANAHSDGIVIAEAGSANCYVDYYGYSYCEE